MSRWINQMYILPRMTGCRMVWVSNGIGVRRYIYYISAISVFKGVGAIFFLGAEQNYDHDNPLESPISGTSFYLSSILIVHFFCTKIGSILHPPNVWLGDFIALVLKGLKVGDETYFFANGKVWGGGGGQNRFHNSLCVICLIRRTLNVKKWGGKFPLPPPPPPPP